MIKFFRQSYAIQYVALALLALALWLPSFVAGKVTMGLDEPVTPIFNTIDHLLGFSPILQHIVAFLLLVLETLIFNAIMVNNQIIGKVSTIGAFVFVLLMSLTKTQTNFFPFLLSAFFILLAISNLYEIYQLPNPELNLLKVGIFTAFASMCYFPSIVLILWVMVSLPIAKKGTFRFQLIPITGFLFTYFLYFGGVFLFGDFPSTIEGYGDWFANIQLSIGRDNLKSIILLSFILVSAVLMFFGSGSANFEKSVAVRTKMTMSILLVVFGILLLFIGGNVLFSGLIIMALSIVISYEFSYMGNTGWAELFLTMFLLLVFANHYYFKLL